MQLLRSRFLVLMMVLFAVLLMAAACYPAPPANVPPTAPAVKAPAAPVTATVPLTTTAAVTKTAVVTSTAAVTKTAVVTSTAAVTKTTVVTSTAAVTKTAVVTSTAAVTKTAVATATVTAKATAPVTRTVAVTPTVSARVTATAVSKAAAVPPLTAAQLENASYLSVNLPGGKATLKDGGFEQSTGPGATQKVVSRIVGPIVMGDLNGDGAADAALILATNTGGSGMFIELHAVLNDGGRPQDAARADLGDRVFLKSLAIDPAGAIVLRMLTHGPKDPMCCPSEEVTQTYKLDGNALKLVSPAAKPGTTPAPAAPPLTVDQLKNGTYLSEYVPAGKVTLKNGKFEQSTGAGATQKVVVSMIEPVALGDLNGDKVSDAAVILATNTGGSGIFYDLHAVLNEGGKPVDVSSVPLGDRVQIRSLTITDGVIVVSMITHGQNDPLCCPTLPVTQSYKLQGGKLVRESAVKAPTIMLAAVVPVSRTITIVTPAEGQAVKSGVAVSGTISVTPFENNLVYRVYAGSNGQVIGSGSLTVKGEQTKPGTFAGPIQFTPG
ncbi:MAG: Gmad2 immunoglobulin-like domain-containing protein, partial [Anaerolineae bacterium]|nr:Gmad2 immunoglobulin-like domain-containing protein [Anaerolineae bacterium]